MRIAIASGKGGAGKTSVAASLASVWDSPLVAVDTDVEAPNLPLFLPPQVEGSSKAWLEVPSLDLAACSKCGKCREICSFKAIASFAGNISIFPDMCHGCGGCFAVCADKALKPVGRELGELEHGTVLDGTVRFLMGRTRIGESMTPPLLRQLREVNDAIPDPVMSQKIARLEEVSGRIFALAQQDPNKKAQLQKFMNYYLPTALRLLNTYASLSGQAVEGTNITEAKRSIERSMDLLVTAFENQLDKLFQADALDVNADIAALEGMLNLDGLTGSDFPR